MRADVAAFEFVIADEAELRGDVAHWADLAVHHLAQALQPPPVHEHHPVHELHAVLLARGDDFCHVICIDAHRLLYQHMLARLRCADDPLFAQSRGQGDVHGIDVRARQQRRVVIHRLRYVGMRRAALAFIYEGLRACEITTGHRDERGIAGITDGLPVFTSNESGTQDAPATVVVVHALMKHAPSPPVKQQAHSITPKRAVMARSSANSSSVSNALPPNAP